MAKHTFGEKVRYNEQRMTTDDFAMGYTAGVILYQRYPAANKETRKEIDRQITVWKELAKQKNHMGKGVLCGLRDAAKERKAKKKN